MISKFKALNKCFVIAIIVGVISILAFCSTAFLFSSRMDIPLGIIFGGVLFSLLNVLQGLAEQRDNKRSGFIFSIIMITVKFLVVIAAIVLAGFMYYQWGMPYLNIFCIVGVYSVSILATILVYILKKE